MARTKAFDDTAAVRAARDVFWRYGYAATSLAQLQSATGLSKSSLYESYGSKRGLFARSIDSYLGEVITPLLGPLEADGAGRAELARYFAALAGVFRGAPASVARRGCLLLNTAMELDELDAEAAVAVRDYRERVRAAFERALAGAGIPDAGARADLLTAAQIGVMITSRLDPEAAAALADTIVADLP